MFLRQAATIVLVFGIVSFSSAQDLSAVSIKKPLEMSGGINATTTFYNAVGIQPRRDPYFWMFNANLNLKLLGVIDAPFSATLTSQNKEFSQPGNFTGISPKYKWITVHAGYRSLNFSQFSYSG